MREFGISMWPSWPARDTLGGSKTLVPSQGTVLTLNHLFSLPGRPGLLENWVSLLGRPGLLENWVSLLGRPGLLEIPFAEVKHCTIPRDSTLVKPPIFSAWPSWPVRDLGISILPSWHARDSLCGSKTLYYPRGQHLR